LLHRATEANERLALVAVADGDLVAVADID
jgi:hypothetical protein